MPSDFEYEEVQTGLPAERALDVASAVVNLVPLIGGPFSNILDGISRGRKEQRILEVVQGVSEDLRDFNSSVADEYVKTEEFEELLENTLRRAAEERTEEKRRLYRNILTRGIKNPGREYDDQIRFVNMLGELSVDHIVILRALSQEPKSHVGMMGSPMQTLKERVPDRTEAQIEQLVNELNDQRITSLTSLRTMMTGRGAADLRGAVTPFGQQFLSYIEAC